MKQSIGDRMKNFYENITRYFLPRRTYTIIRCDGKSFKNYTSQLVRPFDDGLINDMDATAAYLCKNIQGAKFAYVQSDEISILLTDFDDINTSAWFDGNVQKIASVSSSLATSKFNQLRTIRDIREKYDKGIDKITELWIENLEKLKLGEFDSRDFTITSKAEVKNYFIFRQEDATRNSISSVARSLYSHKELNNKNSNQMQEMIFQKGTNWNDYSPKYKRGRIIVKQQYEKEGAIRNKWVSIEPPVFTQDKDFLDKLIPKN